MSMTICLLVFVLMLKFDHVGMFFVLVVAFVDQGGGGMPVDLFRKANEYNDSRYRWGACVFEL